MNPFQYSRASDVGGAVKQAAGARQSRFLAGGTNLLDMMKLYVEQPTVLVDIGRLPLAKIEDAAGGGLKIGANVRNSDLAYDERVKSKYGVLSDALLSGASAQLRNMATVGGNLMQRTRCPYFRDGYSPCNKREPDSGCSALEGHNRGNAVLGVSEHCIATHPSDMCVALAILDASIRVQGPNGERTIAFRDFHLEPGNTPQRETQLQHGELIVSVELPPLAAAVKTHYLKVRDRASYEFALASAAVALEAVGGEVKTARIALGGVGTKPWRAFDAEKKLVGRKADRTAFELAAEEALKGAIPRRDNGFKVALAKRVIVRALETVAKT